MADSQPGIKRQSGINADENNRGDIGIVIPNQRGVGNSYVKVIGRPFGCRAHGRGHRNIIISVSIEVNAVWILNEKIRYNVFAFLGADEIEMPRTLRVKIAPPAITTVGI
jgi:hypothetical protein